MSKQYLNFMEDAYQQSRALRDDYSGNICQIVDKKYVAGQPAYVVLIAGYEHEEIFTEQDINQWSTQRFTRWYAFDESPYLKDGHKKWDTSTGDCYED